MKIFYRLAIYAAALWGILILTSCASAPQTESAAGAKATLTLAKPTLSPSQTPLPPPTDSPTETPIVDANGNVTWHPQKVLISWDESPNDGNSAYTNPDFVLYWDGTLLQPSYDSSGNSTGPSIAKLSQDEICKVLNTVEASGFFEEPNDYSFPFAGGWGSYIGVNSWKSNWSGAQQLYSAIRGEPYYNVLFCRNCPIPSEETIIRPALANTYYLLQNYLAKNSHLAEIKKWHVSFYSSDDKPNQVWPLTSISFEQFLEKCHGDVCLDTGVDIDGDIAKEFLQKIQQDQPYPWELSSNYNSIKMYVQDIWPSGPDVPADATLTCNTKTGYYPLLPLNPNNKFWYYAPGGQWGAEVVANENKIRVVNTSGYEKFYSYDAAFFGQPSIQFYPRYWSEDGQFFYVNILPGEFKPNVSLVNSIGLEQIDVQNEKIKYLFLGTKGETFAYEFSTDRESVAYIRQGDDPLKLVIVNTVSGEEHAVRLTRPDGTPYTSAGTLIWSAKDDAIYLAANYTENGTAKTDILGIHPAKLADLHILYAADKLITISKDEASSSTASICYLETGTNRSCLDLDIETGEVK